MYIYNFFEWNNKSFCALPKELCHKELLIFKISYNMNLVERK